MNKIKQKLKDFKLAGVIKNLELRLEEAKRSNLGYSEFLELILEDEKDNRNFNRKKKLYQKAKLPFQKGLEDFDFSFQPSIKKKEILELGTCKFIEKHQNIIFIGQAGTGKTHLSVSLGLKALDYGYKVMFTTVWEIITALEQARADFSYKRKIREYMAPDLLILDELGYKSMAESTVEDFFEIVSKRYEKGSIILTSNRDYGNWDKIFIDKTLTSAVVDRLIHHSHTIFIKGESYRVKDKLKNN